MNKQTIDTRQHILETGYQLVAFHGYSNVGLSQLLKQAGVPKGSFYHYFKSKEHFGEALIEDYKLNYQDHLRQCFSPDNGNAYQQLIKYWQGWIDSQSGLNGTNKCLVVKLSAEVADLSEPMRLALLTVSASILETTTACIRTGIEEGSITVKDAQQCAHLLYSLWLGASLHCKLANDSKQLTAAMQTTEDILQNKFNT